MANVLFKQGTAAKYAALATKDANTFYLTTDDNMLYLGEQLLSDHANVTALQNAIANLTAAQVEYEAGVDGAKSKSVKDAIDEILIAIGEGGAVADQIEAAINALDATVSIVDEDNENPLNITIVQENGKVKTVTSSIDDVFDAKGAAATAKSQVIGAEGDAATADTIYGAKAAAKTAADNAQSAADAAQEAADDAQAAADAAQGDVDALDSALAPVAKSGNASDVAVADEAGNLDATTVEAALAEIVGKINSASSDAAVTVEKTVGGENDDFVTKYTFKQGGAPIANGEITLAKDMVATAGELVDEDDKGTKGTFIKMTIANGTPFYINVADLIEYNAVADTDEIKLTDTNHTITATVGEIAASKIIYKTVTDEECGTVTKTTVAQAINALETASTTGVDDKINAKVATLNADVDAELAATETDNEAVAVVGGVTEANGVLTAVDSVAVDKAGAATRAKEAVIGTGTGRSGAGTEEDPYVYADTVKGAKTYAKDLVDAAATDAAKAVSDLDVNEFALATVASNVVTIKGIKETDGKIEVGVDTTKDVTLEEIAMTGAAADLSVSDAGNYFDGANAEAILQEIGLRLTWQEI